MVDIVRQILSEIAPEIPEAEITPDATFAELGLDDVSIWALATSMERVAKVQFKDADIGAATGIADLLALLPSQEESEDLDSAMEDLAKFFN